jgi:hypothetical protein
MNHKCALIFFVLVILLTGCNLTSPTISATVVPSAIPSLEFVQPTPSLLASPTSLPSTIPIPPSSTPLSTQQEVHDRAAEVISAFKDKDMVSLSNYVHPEMGLRFSPYAYVKDTDQVFPSEKVAGLMTDNTVYTWGVYDGSGEPIALSFPDYYSKFIYDVDFADAPQVALNTQLGTGNSIDNSLEFYPGSMIVEYYFPGFDAQYAGMDWRSLRLVFIEYNNTWYLAGVIHDQWTI